MPAFPLMSKSCDVINFVRQITDSTTNTPTRLQEVKTKFFIKLSQELSPGHMNEPLLHPEEALHGIPRNMWGVWPERSPPL